MRSGRSRYANRWNVPKRIWLCDSRTSTADRVGEGSFAVWLSRLARNLLIDHYRRTKLDRVTDSIETQLPMLQEKASGSTRADGILAGREASEVLQAGLQKLSPELREAEDRLRAEIEAQQAHKES